MDSTQTWRIQAGNPPIVSSVAAFASTWPADQLNTIASYSPSILVPNSSGIAGCKNSNSGTLLGANAQERAEIRGWLLSDINGNNGEDELEFDVLLDIGWYSRAPGTYAVNTLDRLMPYITPANIFENGRAEGALGGQPTDGSYSLLPNSAILNTDQSGNWGGDFSGGHCKSRGWSTRHHRAAATALGGATTLRLVGSTIRSQIRITQPIGRFLSMTRREISSIVEVTMFD